MRQEAHVSASHRHTPVEELVDRICTRLALAHRVISDELDAQSSEEDGATVSLLEGLRQLLLDTLADMEPLQDLPFPITEYAGGSIVEWYAAHPLKVHARRAV